MPDTTGSMILCMMESFKNDYDYIKVTLDTGETFAICPKALHLNTCNIEFCTSDDKVNYDASWWTNRVLSQIENGEQIYTYQTAFEGECRDIRFIKEYEHDCSGDIFAESIQKAVSDANSILEKQIAMDRKNDAGLICTAHQVTALDLLIQLEKYGIEKWLMIPFWTYRQTSVSVCGSDILSFKNLYRLYPKEWKGSFRGMTMYDIGFEKMPDGFLINSAHIVSCQPVREKMAVHDEQVMKAMDQYKQMQREQ